MKIAVTGLRGIPASWGGVEHHCEEIYSRLALKGHEITIYARSHYVQKDIKSYKGMKIKTIPTINTKFTEAFSHTFLSTLNVLSDNPDIVHFHAQGPCLFSALPRLIRPRMRIFFTCHGLDWQRKKWSWWASKFIYLGEICSTVFPHYRTAVSKELKRYYSDKYGVPVYYIPNGIKKPEKRSPHLINKFNLTKRNYFLFVGRIVPEKRLEDIIEAFLSKPKKSKLVIVGESADTRNYMDFLKQITNANQSIIFTGYQYGEMLEELYSNARAFITASELEGLPITLLEALSYGTPCIASSIAPHKEVLEGIDSHMFTTGEVNELAKLIDTVENLTDNGLDEFGIKISDIVCERFSWDTAVGILEQLYYESLNRLN